MNKAPSRAVTGIVGRSPMFRVLLPTGALLVAMVAGSVVGVAVKNSDAARVALSAKTKLIADIAGRGTVDAIWNLDAKLAKASLAALAADPDYVGSELSDDHGALLAADGAKQAESGTLIVEKVPVVRNDQGQQKIVGALELRMSTARADAAIAEETRILILIGIGALIVVCGLLLWILKSATRPIVALTKVMAKLSLGELDFEIPALDRGDAFQGLVTTVAKDGALSLRTKELMALAIAIAIRCEGCMLHHVSAALKHGASRQEVVETITVAIEMGGGPSTVYGATALAMFDEVSAT